MWSSRLTQGLRSLVDPFVSLLDLVRAKRFDIRTFPAARSARSAHHYVKQASNGDLGDIGELSATMSLLLLMKSRELTPWLIDDDFDSLPGMRPSRSSSAISILEPGIIGLHSRLEAGLESVPRMDYVGGAQRWESLKPLIPEVLRVAYEAQVEAQRSRQMARVAPNLFIRVETAIRSVTDSLRRLRSFTFFRLVRENSLDRRAAVMYFLAILDLARTGTVRVQQDAPFEDMMLEGVGSLLPETPAVETPG
jgi:chromatin segregation and condensation protein Rec8/ScpA/Scc1 (kleisin family)